MTMNRRFFDRVDVAANGELIWATKGIMGRVQTHRAYLMTENLSVDGAKLILRGKHHLPPGIRAQLKLGLELCDVELLEVKYPSPGRTSLRVTFMAPNRRFLEVVEKFLPIGNTVNREVLAPNWIGNDDW
jgi:hypothetical protein